MLAVSQLHGFNARRRASAPAGTPASFIFNGTDEYLTRTLSTSGASTTICTISVWCKRASGGSGFDALVGVNGALQPSCVLDIGGLINGGTPGIFLAEAAIPTYGEITATIPSADTWEHWVFRYDSTQATSDNRIRIYRGGALQADSAFIGEPSLNLASGFFVNGVSFLIGNDVFSEFFQGKLAFIDVLEGVSADPTSFAFDNGGTWTRLNYAGSYGTYGFSLDGSDGFNDTSGNAQHFTGVNMTPGSNLDAGDLPPYTN